MVEWLMKETHHGVSTGKFRTLADGTVVVE